MFQHCNLLWVLEIAKSASNLSFQEKIKPKKITVSLHLHSPRLNIPHPIARLIKFSKNDKICDGLRRGGFSHSEKTDEDTSAQQIVPLHWDLWAYELMILIAFIKKHGKCTMKYMKLNIVAIGDLWAGFQPLFRENPPRFPFTVGCSNLPVSG